jgi:hypothetical protein
VTQLRSRLDDPPTEIAISLMTAYFAYLPAVALDVSGVLAAVTVGIYLGWNAPRLVTSPETRIQAIAVWGMLVFVLNVLLFVLLGLQFHGILDSLSGYSTATLVGYGALTSAVVIAVRILWVFPFTYLPQSFFRRVRERDRNPPWQLPMIVAWNGIRGAISLAAALAIPLETDAGAPFPGRDLIIYLTFCVILATLVVQGLSMPRLTPSACAPCTSTGGAASRRGSTIETTARSTSSRSRISGFGGRRWRPSVRRSWTCGGAASSTTRCGGGSSATSTSRTHGSRSDRGGDLTFRLLGSNLRTPRPDSSRHAQQHGRLHRLPRDRRAVDAPAAVPHLRSRRLLRLLAEQARQQACGRDRPPDRALVRAGGGLVLVLPRRGGVRAERASG